MKGGGVPVKEEQVSHTHDKNKVTNRPGRTHTNTRTQNEQRRNDRLIVEVAVVAPKIVLV